LSALHRTVPRLFELDEIGEGLNKVGFDVRVAKDETKSYKTALLNDIRKFGDTVAGSPLSQELQEWIMWKVEYWARTFAALDAGGITMHRIHAVTPVADPTKSKYHSQSEPQLWPSGDGDTLNLDIKWHRPRAHSGKGARWWIMGKVFGIDLIDGAKEPGISGVNIALHHLVQR